MQTLTDIVDHCERRDGRLVAQVSEDWTQGRSLYGGLQAVLAVEAMQPFSEGLPLRTLQATLCAPVPAGAIEIRAHLLRQGKNTQQVEARIASGDDTLALFTGIFGRDRESVVLHDVERPDVAGSGTPMPYIKGVMPAFLQNFDVTMLHGHFPGAGKRDTAHRFRVGLKDSTPAAALRHVLAIADHPPPIGLSWLPAFKAGSTMTWMLNFTGHAFDGLPLDGWTLDVTLESARAGYTVQTVAVFAPDGRPIVRGTQCMVVFG